MTSNVTQQQTQYLIGRAVTTPRKTTEWVCGIETRLGQTVCVTNFTILHRAAKPFLSKDEAREVLAHLPANKGWAIYRAAS